MNQEDVFDLMQSVPDTKYALVILLKNDNTFTHKNYGETSFLQSLGLIDAVRHEILQKPHEDLHIESFHNEKLW